MNNKNNDLLHFINIFNTLLFYSSFLWCSRNSLALVYSLCAISSLFLANSLLSLDSYLTLSFIVFPSLLITSISRKSFSPPAGAFTSGFFSSTLGFSCVLVSQFTDFFFLIFFPSGFFSKFTCSFVSFSFYYLNCLYIYYF